MKEIFIDLVSHKTAVTSSAVVLPSLEGSAIYTKRCNSFTIISKGVSKEISNYTLAYLLQGANVRLLCDKGLFRNEEIISHISAVQANRYEDFKLDELLQKTWNLIVKNNIPLDVVRNIDLYIPADKLSQYDIQLGQTELPVIKMNTYKPTDLQRKDWGVADKSFAFSKTKTQYKYQYTTTLYDKLIAWLQLKFYTENNIAPLYTTEEIQCAELVTPYSAVAEENYYERICY